MTPSTGPDLAALREMLAAYDDAEEWKVPGIVRETLDVLSLVDDQQKENERLREYARHLPGCRMERILGPSECSCGLEAALAGPPAANEITSAPWRGLEGWNVGVEFRGDDVVVMARAPGQSVWRDLLTVTR